MDTYFRAALNLHRYLLAEHWRGDALVGPDVGVRVNYRLGRFVKGYLRALPWRDALCYQQAQGYWTLANWQLAALTGDASFRDVAERCSAGMLARQRADGAWDYPNPEWKGRVATAEGTWASIGLIESFRHTSDPRFLDGALRWHRFSEESIGYDEALGGLAVNYFAGQREAVPNNAAFMLRFLAELADATADRSFLARCPGLLAFMAAAQMPTGEFPYEVGVPGVPRPRAHFQCYQYNAFQCLDLIRYYELTRDASALPLVRRVLGFLAGGVARDGQIFFDCGHGSSRVTYHPGALAAAFARSQTIGIGGYEELPARAYGSVVRDQAADGSLPYSHREYRVVRDARRYPRSLSMILHHLLVGVEVAQRREGRAA